jgi:hypothetical protein
VSRLCCREYRVACLRHHCPVSAGAVVARRSNTDYPYALRLRLAFGELRVGLK